MRAEDDPFAAKDEFGVRPQWVYRKSHPETRKILGLGPTAIEEAIKDGTLPEPAPLTKHGKAVGWMGFQLIEVIKKRLAAAPQRAANPPRPVKKKKTRPPLLKPKTKRRHAADERALPDQTNGFQ